jgi:aerobic carbon-monoxide dehydrogenase large subunit
MNAPTAARFVGQSIKRREDPRLLTGHGRFVADVVWDDQLEVAFLRSDIAAGDIKSIDISAAEALPGVVAVFTGDDLNAEAGDIWTTTAGPPAFGPPMHPLANGDVRYVGDPIAVVVAETRYIAEDAVELIVVDIESRQAVVSLEDALDEASLHVHPEMGPNVVEEPMPAHPEWDATVEAAAHVVSRRYAMARVTNVPMEGRGLVAHYDKWANSLKIFASTQSPHETKAWSARLLEIPENRVTVEFGDVGGGFGQKMYPTRDEAAVLLAAKLVGRPVRWIEDRRENLIAANQARHDISELTIAVEDDGKIAAMSFDLTTGVGAYPAGGSVGGGGMLVAMMFTGPYRTPAATGFNSRTFVTNTCGWGAYRGPWAVETISREQIVDAAARAAGIDPLEMRRRNVITAAELPYEHASGMPLMAVTPEESLNQAAEILDYDAFRADQAAAREEGRYLGVGISAMIEPSAVGFGAWATEAAIVRIEVNGQVEVLMGTGSHGHSLETTIPQIVAEHLGCSFEDVVLRQGGDTPYGPGTGGSRSAVIAGGAAQTASTELREKIVAIAAHLLEANPEDLEVADSKVSVKGTPAKAVSFAELAGLAYLNPAELPEGTEAGLEASNRFSPPMPFTWSNATHICTVEVDAETGEIKLLRYIVSEDCGTMINPMVVEGQIAGGAVQGIGGALWEDMAYDADGNPLATTFLDYLMPSSSELPDFEYGHLQTPSISLGGYKGLGEGGAIAAPAAVANAINDALSPFGAECLEFPITPTRVLRSIDAAQSRAAQS